MLTVSQVGPTPSSPGLVRCLLSLHDRASWPNGTFSEDPTSEQSKPARTKAQQHCSQRDTPTHAPHSTRHQHQWKLTATRVDLAQMLSKSCAIRTISTSGLQCSSWPGDKWHVFLLRWHFHALSAIRIRPSFVLMNVKAFPKCLLAACALEHTICTMCNVLKLSSRLSSRLLICGAFMFIGW